MNHKKMTKEIIAIIFFMINFFLLWKNEISFEAVFYGIEFRVNYLILTLLSVYLFFCDLEKPRSFFKFISIFIFSLLANSQYVIPLLFLNELEIQRDYVLNKVVVVQNVLNVTLFAIFATFFINKGQGLELSILNYFLLVIILTAKNIIQFLYRAKKKNDERIVFNFIVLLTFLNKGIEVYSNFLLILFSGIIILYSILFFTSFVNQKELILKESMFYLAVSTMLMGSPKLGTILLIASLIYINNIETLINILEATFGNLKQKKDLKIILLGLSFSLLSPIGLSFLFLFHFSAISPLMLLMGIIVYIQFVGRHIIDDFQIGDLDPVKEKSELAFKALLSLFCVYFYTVYWLMRSDFDQKYSLLAWLFLFIAFVVGIIPSLLTKMGKLDFLKNLINEWKIKFPARNIEKKSERIEHSLPVEKINRELYFEEATPLNEGKLATIGLIVLIIMILLFLNKAT